MIEMQYNFPLLPGLPAAWRERLRWAVDELGDDDFDGVRPTFRIERPELTRVGCGVAAFAGRAFVADRWGAPWEPDRHDGEWVCR